jgi:hypothetical protein
MSLRVGRTPAARISPPPRPRSSRALSVTSWALRPTRSMTRWPRSRSSPANRFAAAARPRMIRPSLPDSNTASSCGPGAKLRLVGQAQALQASPAADDQQPLACRPTAPDRSGRMRKPVRHHGPRRMPEPSCPAVTAQPVRGRGSAARVVATAHWAVAQCGVQQADGGASTAVLRAHRWGRPLHRMDAHPICGDWCINPCAGPGSACCLGPVSRDMKNCLPSDIEN